MSSAFEKLKDKIAGALSEDIADILGRFQYDKNPVIYNSERSRDYLLQEGLLRTLGFLDIVTGDSDYPFLLCVLNEKAREIYEELKKEGYYRNVR